MVAALAVLSSFLDYIPAVPHRWFLLAIAIAAACELTAFALRPREATGVPLDAMEVGVRFVCGAVFGAVALPFAVWIQGWTGSPMGLTLLSLAGAVVCGGLVVRFGNEFWRWVRSSRSPF